VWDCTILFCNDSKIERILVNWNLGRARERSYEIHSQYILCPQSYILKDAICLESYHLSPLYVKPADPHPITNANTLLATIQHHAYNYRKLFLCHGSEPDQEVIRNGQVRNLENLPRSRVSRQAGLPENRV